MQELSEDAIAGSISGFISRTLTSPLDVIKIRFQLQCNLNKKYYSVIQSIQSIINEEGVMALWKGNIPGIYLWVSYSLFQFSSYGFLKKNISSFETKYTPKTFLNFCIGTTASLFATIITYPFDIMRTQFAIQGQKRIHHSIFSYCQHTFHSHGIQGFYPGLSAAMISIGPYMGLNFGFYEIIKIKINNLDLTHHYDPKNKLISIIVSLISGAIAGGFSKILVYPLDTIKKKLQAEVLYSTFNSKNHHSNSSNINKNPIKYINLRHCIQKVYQEEGFNGFFKGLSPTILKSIFSTSIAFGTFEMTKLLIKKE